MALHKKGSGLEHRDANVTPQGCLPWNHGPAALKTRIFHCKHKTQSSAVYGKSRLKQSKRGIHVSPAQPLPSLTSGLASVHQALPQNWALAQGTFDVHGHFSFMCCADGL